MKKQPNPVTSGAGKLYSRYILDIENTKSNDKIMKMISDLRSTYRHGKLINEKSIKALAVGLSIILNQEKLNDDLADFLFDNVNTDVIRVNTSAAEVYRRYWDYHSVTHKGQPMISNTEFYNILRSKGYVVKPGAGNRLFCQGVKLHPNPYFEDEFE